MEEPSAAPRSAAPLILATVLPLAVVAAWWVVFCAPDPPTARSQETVRLEAILDERPRDVLILGNSVAFRGIDEQALEAALGGPTVGKLTIPGARSAMWLAILENRVYARDHHPRLVVIPAPMSHLLEPTPDREWHRTTLRGQMGPDEPEIEAKIFKNGSWAALDRANRRAAELLDLPKILSVWATYGEPLADGELLIPTARAFTEPPLAEVFDNERGVDLTLHKRVMPVASIEARRGADQGPLHPDQVLLPELLAEAAEHGTRVVFARMPLASSGDTPVPADAEEALIQLVNRSGAGWIDLTHLQLPDSAFFDHLHLNATGRAAATARLAEQLVALDALGDTPFPPAAMPIRFSAPTVDQPAPPRDLGVGKPTGHACHQIVRAPMLARASDAALLERHGVQHASPVRLSVGGVPLTPHVLTHEDCDGSFAHLDTRLRLRPPAGATGAVTLGFAEDPVARPLTETGPRELWWVAPGQTLTTHTARDLDPGPPVHLDLIGEALGGASPARFRAGTATAEVAPASGRFRVALDDAATSGPLVLDIINPADGPLLLVTDVVLHRDPARMAMLGSTAASRGQSLRIVGDQRYAAEAAWSDPPAPLTGIAPPEALDRSGSPTDPPAARIAVQPWTPLGEKAIWEVTGRSGCSPLRLTEDGERLRHPHARFADVVQKGRGRFVHEGPWLFFSASDNTDPTRNSRAYDLALDPARRCGAARWLYPADTLTLTATAHRHLFAPAIALELGASAFLGEGSGVAVTVRSALGQHLATTLDHEALQDGSLQLPFTKPLPPGAGPAQVVFRSSGGSPYVLLMVVGFTEGTGAAPETLDPTYDLGAFTQLPADAGTLTRGPLGDGHEGLRFSSDGAAARICSAPRPADGDLRIAAELHVPALVPGAGAWQTLVLEDLWLDAAGARVDDAKGRPASRPVRLSATSGWTTLTERFPQPAGAAASRLCFRFARAAGELQLGELRRLPPAE